MDVGEDNKIKQILIKDDLKEEQRKERQKAFIYDSPSFYTLFASNGVIWLYYEISYMVLYLFNIGHLLIIIYVNEWNVRRLWKTWEYLTRTWGIFPCK